MVNVACAHLMWNGHEPHSLKNSGYRKDMFFKYTWNNFLHTQVEICIALILASPLESTENGIITDQDSIGDNLLLKHLFLKCQLVERILEAWEMNEKKQAEGGRWHGYMGHLTRIANCIVHSTDKGPNSALVQQLLKSFQMMSGSDGRPSVQTP
ncbi:serine/threonine-protein phosphatase 6 regulatory subunit 3-like isoform X4 [Chrysemys picta bellii]|uniref:serine/threonine-protein phosphatase 6 regulatory subunit 3-like isoform X4 n=1 Tax=Chrysemys picta bellii TaxID=8478 RepID=UPI0032B16D41